MGNTSLTDITYSDAFGRYVVRRMQEKNAFFKAGICKPDPQIDTACRAAGFGGTTVKLPFWNPLDVESDGGPVNLGPGSTISVNKITAGQDVAAITRRGVAWGAEDLASEIAGDDPMRVVGDQIADFWIKHDGNKMWKCLEGIYGGAAAAAADLILDISTSDRILTPEAILDAAQLLGEHKTELTAIVCHSIVETFLAAIDSRQGSLLRPSDGKSELPTYMGRRMVIDDRAGYDPNTKKADIWLFGAGAVAWNAVPVKVPIERVRTPSSSSEQIYCRHGSITHLRGVAWHPAAGVPSSAPYPSDDEFAGAGNWQIVWPKADIRCVRLIAKLGT